MPLRDQGSGNDRCFRRVQTIVHMRSSLQLLWARNLGPSTGSEYLNWKSEQKPVVVAEQGHACCLQLNLCICRKALHTSAHLLFQPNPKGATRRNVQVLLCHLSGYFSHVGTEHTTSMCFMRETTVAVLFEDLSLTHGRCYFACFLF